MSLHSPGAALRRALTEESPLDIPGATNAHHALLAQQVGFKALYLSGGRVTAGSLGPSELEVCRRRKSTSILCLSSMRPTRALRESTWSCVGRQHSA